MSKLKSVVTTALFAAFFSLCVFSVAPVFAQDAVRSSAERKVQYSREELENFRSDLINFVRAYQEAARFVGSKQAQNFNGIEEQLLTIPLEQLNAIYNGSAGVKKMNSATKKLESAVQQASLRSESKGRQKNEALENASGFPNADYPSCGTSRVDDAIIDASDTALFAAEVVRDVASRGCDQVAVIAGFGANTSTACIIADGIYHAAKIINYGLHYCNDKIDQAEQGATYGRLEHLHSDLETSVANDNANATSILSNDNANKVEVLTNLTTTKTEIINNDNSNKNAIVTNDNNNKNTIVNNDNANKDTIVTAIETAKTTIIVNANANKDELLRLAIAADLSETDNATPVGVFMLPAAKGGYIELVRTIVVHAITNLAGSSISQANSFLAQADAFKAAGDYKKAYALYRKAYKSATN